MVLKSVCINLSTQGQRYRANSLYSTGRPVKVKSNKRLHSSQREDLPLITDSTMQHDYKVPVQNSNLRGNTTRYGCNVGIVKAAHGAVPTLDKQTLPSMNKYKTLYSSDFGSLQRSPVLRQKQRRVGLHLPAINKELHKR